MVTRDDLQDDLPRPGEAAALGLAGAFVPRDDLAPCGGGGDFDLVAVEDDDDPLTPAELAYARASRAPNTLRGYASDWREFQGWCARRGLVALPCAPSTLSGYLTELADAGAKVGTMNRRRSAIRLAHTVARHPDPCTHPRVEAIWDGIRRKHGRAPDQSAPLMPPLLLRVIDACPTEKPWKDPKRAPEPNLAGARDRALLLVGFVGALRRSELTALTLDQVKRHPYGLVLTLTRSKTNQRGEDVELVVLPRSQDVEFCPVAAVHRWLELSGIGSLANIEDADLEDQGEDDGEHDAPSPTDDAAPAEDITTVKLPPVPLFQGVTKGNRASGRPLNSESVNVLVKAAIRRAGRSPEGYSAHSLRAGFVTWANQRGASDRAIARQTRHRSMASLGQYIRISEAWTGNAAADLGL